MIKFEHIYIHGWEAAIRGMRNPLNSWKRSDSSYGCSEEGVCISCGFDPNWCGNTPNYVIGPNDHALMMKLAKAGSEHSKYRRFITVTMDIMAPLYWWKEFDTYKVGTVANSCSTMHKIHAKEFTTDDFSCEHLGNYDADKDGDGICEADDCDVYPYDSLSDIVGTLNYCRERYLETREKKYWWQMIQLLPSSYNQKCTVMLNYEVLAHICQQRKDHKLDEWHEFCDMIKTLPYSEIITLEEGQK